MPLSRRARSTARSASRRSAAGAFGCLWNTCAATSRWRFRPNCLLLFRRGFATYAAASRPAPPLALTRRTGPRRQSRLSQPPRNSVAAAHQTEYGRSIQSRVASRAPSRVGRSNRAACRHQPPKQAPVQAAYEPSIAMPLGLPARPLRRRHRCQLHPGRGHQEWRSGLPPAARFGCRGHFASAEFTDNDAVGFDLSFSVPTCRTRRVPRAPPSTGGGTRRTARR
jgi:hypothetical protein